MLRPFALHQPQTLEGVADLLGEHRDKSALYAGGTELLLLLKEGFLRVTNLIDVKRVPGLGECALEEGSVVVGATVTHRMVECSAALRAACPILPDVAEHVANVRVRNIGTVGGNLAFADPHSDLATLFLALDGSVRLWRRGREREVPVGEFIRGPYETVRGEDEILTAVRLRPWPARTAAAYVKFGIHERPTLGIAVALTLDADSCAVVDARIAVGCVGPRPRRLIAVEDSVRGVDVTEVLAGAESLAAAATELVEPIDDLHGSADYKREMTRVFVRRAIEVVGARATGRESEVRYPHTVVVTSGPGAAAPPGSRPDRRSKMSAPTDELARARRTHGMRSGRLAFRVNGQAVTLDVPAHALLLDVLRDRLGLKAAKRSCDIQVCGACTVLVDGAPVSACTYLAAEVDGRDVSTAEGLGTDGGLHPLQESFIARGAVQCGFCTSGMLMAGKALLDEEPAPAAGRVAAYLRGNLCRCTGYRKLIDAIAGPEASQAVSRTASVIGTSVRRIDAIEKVTGRARYVTDLEVPGMVHAKLLRSPYPHARIARIDARAARAVSGVTAVVAGADLDWCDPYFGPAYRDRPILAIEVARYEGEPVAAVVAEDENVAAQALDLIEVEYEELPAVTTIEAALRPGAPLVHTGEPEAGHFADLSSLRPRPGTNICHQFEFDRGRGAAAFAEADVVVEDTYAFPRAQHCAMEPHCAIAVWDEQGGLTVWASTQNPYSVRVELAKMFRVDLGRIRIVVPLLGGGFGSKTYAKIEPIAAALARIAGRPVRLGLSVDEAFRTVRRCDARVRARLGFRCDGSLLAVECHADFDVGAYADIGPRIIQKGTYTATGPYRVPHVLLRSAAVYTNTTPGGAFRGFGVPQIAWAVESLMDDAARRLERDPVELRRQNLLAHGEEFAPGDTPIDGKFEESLARAAEAIGWMQASAADRGRGVAMMMKASIAPSVSEAIVRLHADASVTVLASTVEMGQGARTVMAQIAAEVLAVPIERVTVATPDTAITPYDQTTSSSRSTVMMGRAVQEAAEDVRGQLLRAAAAQLGVAARQLRVEDGAVVGGGSRLAYPEVLRARFGMGGGELIGHGVVAPGPSRAPLGGSTPFWEMAVGAATISVDEETGAITVDEYTSVADVGRRINPQQCEGQDEGAVMQGLGHTLFEEMVYEHGQLLNASLVDYRVPRAGDLPRRLRCEFVENADGAGPFGAKGAGEGSLVPVSPAVGNALARLTGVRLRELPLTPERVWRALRAHARTDRRRQDTV